MEKLKLYGKKNNGKEEFLGIIYVNEKEGMVIDVKDIQVKEDISQEINKELQQNGGISWPKTRKAEFYTEEDKQLKEKLELLFEKDKKFQKDLGGLKTLWRERLRLSIIKEKLLNKKMSLKEKEVSRILEIKREKIESGIEEINNEIIKIKSKLFFEKDKEIVKKHSEDWRKLSKRREKSLKKKENVLNKQRVLGKALETEKIKEIDQKIKEIEKKINKKMGESFDKLLEIKWSYPYCEREFSSITGTFFALAASGIEKPGSPLFLAALRGRLASSGKKYGGYILSKQLPIVEEAQ